MIHKSLTFSKPLGDVVIKSKAKAKLNLILNVVGKRSDGYHILDSLVAFPDIGDEIVVRKSEHLSLRISGEFSKKLVNKDNLIISATKQMQKLYGEFGCSIHLLKRLPISSGIGGGSSDAAATLRCLSTLLGKPLPDIKLQMGLGADVPVCIEQSFQRMRGVGEILTKLASPPPIYVTLFNSGIELSTTKVFSGLKNFSCKTLDDMPTFNKISTLIGYLQKYGNDLQKSAVKLRPEILEIISRISLTPGCLISQMSGSGGTCFGLYLEYNEAINAKRELKFLYPKAWVQAGTLFSDNSGDCVVS